MNAHGIPDKKVVCGFHYIYMIDSGQESRVWWICLDIYVDLGRSQTLILPTCKFFFFNGWE
jgi:hypothetical protein